MPPKRKKPGRSARAKPAGSTGRPAAQPVESEPLPRPLGECLRTIAESVLAQANEFLGTGKWSGALLSLDFFPDSGVEIVLQLDRKGAPPKWTSLPTESNHQCMHLGQLVAELSDPWRAVDIRVQPDGSCALRSYRGKRTMPDNDEAFRHMVFQGLPPWVREWAGPAVAPGRRGSKAARGTGTPRRRSK